MNKNSSIHSLIYLMIIGMLTKVISMSSRVIMSRDLGLNAVSINSLVNPLFVFGITIASFSLPTTIATLISKNPQKAKKVFFSSMLITLAFNILIIGLIMIFGKYIANNLLHNSDTYPSLRLLTIVIPLTSISSIIKGYFIGKKEVKLTSTSSLVEECSRLLSCIFLVNIFLSQDDSIKSTFFIVCMIIGEIVQTSYLILTSGKKYISKIKKIKGILNIENYEFSEVLKLSFPMTLSRLLTSFTYMLEPIIITSLLLKYGHTSEEITLNYGIISSYVMPLLLFPGFFSLAISNYLLPNLSSYIGKSQIDKGKHLFNQSLIITSIIGIIISILFFFFGGNLLKIIYHVNFGDREIRLLAFPFFIYYLETPVNMTMHALSLSKQAFASSFCASLIRVILLIIFAEPFGVFAVCIATLCSCYLDVISNLYLIRKFFKGHNKKSID